MTRTLRRTFSALLATAALTAGALSGTAQANPAPHADLVPVTMQVHQARMLGMSRELEHHRADIHRVDNGAPVQGLLVVFTTPHDKEPLCEAYTDHRGTAMCNAHYPTSWHVVNMVFAGYEANFYGDGTYAPVSNKGAYGLAVLDA